jgi:thiol-disulfide isomerase/thioredoxin
LDRLTVGSQTYSNVAIVNVTPTDLYFKYEKGIKNVKLRNLDPETQKLFDYDPKVASDVEKQRAADDARYQGAIAASAARGGAVRPGASPSEPQAARTSEDSLADPISNNSLIGKPGPAIEVEKWLGTAPNLKGKFVLVSFWAPWSLPCRKYILQFNAIQKRFEDRLQVVGLIPESDAESDVAGAKTDFPSAVDIKAKMQGTLGVKSIPYVLLMDPKGIVLYEGHPAALGEKGLDAMVAKASQPK